MVVYTCLVVNVGFNVWCHTETVSAHSSCSYDLSSDATEKCYCLRHTSHAQERPVAVLPFHAERHI